MALTIQDVHTRIFDTIQKNRWDHLSHPEVDVFLDMAQTDLFYFYYGDPNKYQAGRPIPPVAHGQNQKLHDSLSRFLKPLDLFPASPPAPNFVTLPADYIHLDSAFYQVDNKSVPIEMVSTDKIARRLSSQVLPLSIDYPFISIVNYASIGTGFQVYPTTVDFTTEPHKAWYLSRPVTPLYAYTQVGRTITWDQGNSVDLNWGDDDAMKIIQGALEYIGMALENNGLVNFSKSKSKGQ